LSREDVGRLAARVSDSLIKGGSVILVHWTGPTNYPLSGDEAAALFIEGIGPGYVVDRADRYAEFRWMCCRAAEPSSLRWASQRRAIDICSGNSAGLSNRRAKRGLRSSIAAHIAPNAGSWMRSSTSRGAISSFSTQFRSRASRPTPYSRRKRPRHAARANAVRKGSRASSQNASGSLLRIARVSATPPGARPSVRPDVITWAVGQWRMRTSWRDNKPTSALSSPRGTRGKRPTRQ
jgi:hypothetical protein